VSGVALRSGIIFTKCEPGQPIRSWFIAFFAADTLSYTRWSWSLTPWPRAPAVTPVSCDQTTYQIWERSINTRLSYWWFTIAFFSFSSVLGAPIPADRRFQRGADQICTKFGGCPSLKRIYVPYSVSKRGLLKIDSRWGMAPKIALFDPFLTPCKNYRKGGEISHMVTFWRCAAKVISFVIFAVLDLRVCCCRP